MNSENYEQYIESLKVLDDEGLEVVIQETRAMLAAHDALLFKHREEQSVPPEEVVNNHATLRIRLRLAEHTLSARHRPEYGDSPSNWLIEEEETSEHNGAPTI